MDTSFKSRKDKAAKREEWAPPFICCDLETVSFYIPPTYGYYAMGTPPPTATMLWGTFIFLKTHKTRCITCLDFLCGTTLVLHYRNNWRFLYLSFIRIFCLFITGRITMSRCQPITENAESLHIFPTLWL